MSTDKIVVPFNRPDIDEADIARVVATLRSGWITTGPVVREFEAGLREYLAVPHVVCLNSATAAMEMALLALGVGPGDEVVTTVYTYAATANVVRHTGARLVLVDIGPQGFSIDPVAVAAVLGERTKAVIPVDIAGIPCNYPAIRAAVDALKGKFVASNEYQECLGTPTILADAAHAFGARFGGRRFPAGADMAAYSFHAVKNLTTAEGGALAFADLGSGQGLNFGEQSSGRLSEAFERRVRLLALHGQSKDALAKMAAGSWEYDIEISGYKHNMTDLQAALGIGQLARYGARLERRRAICRRYQEGLPESLWIHPFDAFLDASPEDRPAFHIYPLRIRGYDVAKRNALIASLALEGVAANVHFKPLPLFTAFRDEFDIMQYPNAWAAWSSEITLPLYPGMTDEQVDYVIMSLRKIVGLD